MVKWEYCTLSQVPSGPVQINIVYCTPDGARSVQHRTDSYEEGSRMLWPRTIAELGQAGWELVAVEAGVWHFKRPLAEGQV